MSRLHDTSGPESPAWPLPREHMPNFKFLTLAVAGLPTVRLSADLHFHLSAPSLKDICEARNCFWSIQLMDCHQERQPTHWWKLATEAEELLLRFADYSI